MADMNSSGTSFEDLGEEEVNPVLLHEGDSSLLSRNNLDEKDLVKDFQSLSCSVSSSEDNWISLEDENSKLDQLKKIKLASISDCLAKSDIKGLEKLGESLYNQRLIKLINCLFLFCLPA